MDNKPSLTKSLDYNPFVSSLGSMFPENPRIIVMVRQAPGPYKVLAYAFLSHAQSTTQELRAGGD